MLHNRVYRGMLHTHESSLTRIALLINPSATQIHKVCSAYIQFALSNACMLESNYKNRTISSFAETHQAVYQLTQWPTAER